MNSPSAANGYGEDLFDAPCLTAAYDSTTIIQRIENERQNDVYDAPSELRRSVSPVSTFLQNSSGLHHIDRPPPFPTTTANTFMSAPLRVPYLEESYILPGMDDTTSTMSRRTDDIETLVDEMEGMVKRTDRYGFYTSDTDIEPSCDDNNTAAVFATSSLQTESVPLDVLRRRETKWIGMIGDWRHYMDDKFPKVRARCRKGIPPSIRPRAWKYLCGAQYHMQQFSERTAELFHQLDCQPGLETVNDDIRKDVHRQFPTHELFATEGVYGEMGQENLYRLLKAYSVLNREDGYCQAMAPIAATLLMHMPLTDAFYCFVQICHKYMPGYFRPGLEAVQLDGDILHALLKRVAPSTYKLFKKHGVTPSLYMLEWFMCLFCRTLPWSTVLRVWDMYFCEGVKVLFRVALVLLRYGIDRSRSTGMMEILEQLRSLPPALTHESFLIPKMYELRLADEDFERVHRRVLKAKLKSNKRKTR